MGIPSKDARWKVAAASGARGHALTDAKSAVKMLENIEQMLRSGQFDEAVIKSLKYLIAEFLPTMLKQVELAGKEGGKTARSMLTKEQIAERMFKSADRLFNGRVEMRQDYDVLQDAYDDATGMVTHDLYANKDVKATKDAIHQLDQEIGQVARQMEHLARLLKKGA